MGQDLLLLVSALASCALVGFPVCLLFPSLQFKFRFFASAPIGFGCSQLSHYQRICSCVATDGLDHGAGAGLFACCLFGHAESNDRSSRSRKGDSHRLLHGRGRLARRYRA